MSRFFSRKREQSLKSGARKMAMEMVPPLPPCLWMRSGAGGHGSRVWFSTGPGVFVQSSVNLILARQQGQRGCPSGASQSYHLAQLVLQSPLLDSLSMCIY